MQHRVERSGPELIAAAVKLLDHPLTVHFALCRVVQHMHADEARKQVMVVHVGVQRSAGRLQGVAAETRDATTQKPTIRRGGLRQRSSNRKPTSAIVTSRPLWTALVQIGS